MTKMIEYVDDLNARLSEVSSTEQTLIRALDQALSSVDRKLLADVRDLTLAHEARRVVILQELQLLASRIGAFPAPREQQPAIEDGGQVQGGASPADSSRDAMRVGDWRQAVSNIRDELDDFFNGGSPH